MRIFCLLLLTFLTVSPCKAFSDEETAELVRSLVSLANNSSGPLVFDDVILRIRKEPHFALTITPKDVDFSRLLIGFSLSADLNGNDTTPISCAPGDVNCCFGMSSVGGIFKITGFHNSCVMSGANSFTMSRAEKNAWKAIGADNIIDERESIVNDTSMLTWYLSALGYFSFEIGSLSQVIDENQIVNNDFPPGVHLLWPAGIAKGGVMNTYITRLDRGGLWKLMAIAHQMYETMNSKLIEPQSDRVDAMICAEGGTKPVFWDDIPWDVSAVYPVEGGIPVRNPADKSQSVFAAIEVGLVGKDLGMRMLIRSGPINKILPPKFFSKIIEDTDFSCLGPNSAAWKKNLTQFSTTAFDTYFDKLSLLYARFIYDNKGLVNF